MWSPVQLALLREAGIAGNSLSAGLAALRKANYAHVGLYSHAFFSLSIGFERFLKLLYVMELLIETGQFPTNDELRTVGHDIEKLFERAQAIKAKYNIDTDPVAIDGESVETQIILFLSRFAKSTRYYNLNLVTGNARNSVDPIADWFANIGKPVLRKHFSPGKQAKVKRSAEEIERIIGQFALVDHTAEDGVSLDNVYTASYQTGMTEIVRKYGTLYSARLCKFLYYILLDLRHRCHSKQIQVPYLDELFFPFMNSDAYLLSLRTFPPRGQ